MRRLVTMALALLLSTLAASSPSMAAEASQIILKDGTIFSDVSFKVDNQYKLITLTDADRKRSISFSQIDQIIDPVGNNVTKKYLGKYYNPSARLSGEAEQTTTSGSTPPSLTGEHEQPVQTRSAFVSEAEQPAIEHPFKTLLRVGPNFSAPTGTYFEGMTSGLGYGLDLVIPVVKNIAFRGTISRCNFGVDLASIEDIPNVVIGGDDLNAGAWRFMMSAQYFKWPDWESGGKQMYYCYVGIGVLNITLDGSFTVKDPYGDGASERIPVDESETKFAQTVGGGIMFMASEKIGIQLGAAADLVFVGTASTSEYSYYGAAEYALVFGLKAGVAAVL
ncbi:MAG: hypothetical protein KAY32_17065 [Candidatus Eisenbacteria sp.]|nr:hypothetical protein [Candidatus Eisenbacteria bacterium]